MKWMSKAFNLMKTIINNDNKVEDRWEVDTEVPCQEETSGRNTRTKNESFRFFRTRLSFDIRITSTHD